MEQKLPSGLSEKNQETETIMKSGIEKIGRGGELNEALKLAEKVAQSIEKLKQQFWEKYNNAGDHAFYKACILRGLDQSRVDAVAKNMGIDCTTQIGKSIFEEYKNDISFYSYAWELEYNDTSEMIEFENDDEFKECLKNVLANISKKKNNHTMLSFGNTMNMYKRKYLLNSIKDINCLFSLNERKKSGIPFTQYQEILSLLPENVCDVTTLTASVEQLGVEGYISYLQNTPRWVLRTSLIVSSFANESLSFEEYKQLFSAIPKHCKQLYLSLNFTGLSVNEITELMKLIPYSVEHIGCNFETDEMSDLHTIFSVLHSNIHVLKLPVMTAKYLSFHTLDLKLFATVFPEGCIVELDSRSNDTNSLITQKQLSDLGVTIRLV